jgi:hypothetical protein
MFVKFTKYTLFRKDYGPWHPFVKMNIYWFERYTISISLKTVPKMIS